MDMIRGVCFVSWGKGSGMPLLSIVGTFTIFVFSLEIKNQAGVKKETKRY